MPFVNGPLEVMEFVATFELFMEFVRCFVSDIDRLDLALDVDVESELDVEILAARFSGVFSAAADSESKSLKAIEPGGISPDFSLFIRFRQS